MVEIVLLPEAGLDPAILSNAEIVTAAGLLHAWLDHEVAPAWSQGQYAVKAVVRGQPVPAPTDHVWLFWLCDTTDVPGAGGYHDLDANGNPFAKIFVGDAKRAGYPWEVVLTHEAAETAVNRFIDAMVLADYQGQPAGYFQEVGDPFEGGPSYPYHYQGQIYQVCNFALPAYYKSWAHPPYDRLGLGTAPLTPTAGGLQTVFPVTGNPIQFDHTGRTVREGDEATKHISRRGHARG